MNITTATTTLVHIELTETEARTALVEPASFQNQLRAALAPVGEQRQARKSLSLGTGRPKVVHASASAKAGGKVPCPICGKPLKKNSINYHLKHSHPNAAPAATA